LEAVQVYAVRGNPLNLYDLVSSRDENWEQLIVQRNEILIQEIEDPLRYLFNGYHFPKVGAKAIEIGSLHNSDRRILIRTQAYQLIEEADGRRLRIPVEEPNLSSQMLDVQIALEIQDWEGSRYLTSVSGDSRDNIYRRRLYSLPKEGISNFQVVPTRNLNDRRVSSLWDNVNLTDLEGEVVSCLRIVDPRIKAVALIGDVQDARVRDARRVAVVKYEGSSERIPLKNMGDGIIRLFHIALALANARAGFLLIDEFENGLHWSIQPKIWDIIFRLAESLNVQVFATTHSQDCVRGFQSVWSCRKEYASFYRLEANSEFGAKAVGYTCETLSDALETEVEFR
jgi:ABC-type arginine transport system ATPase subunit